MKFKIRLFNAACVSILLYGCETWILNDRIKIKLDIYARKCYRIMLDINQQETRMTDESLYETVGEVPISTTVAYRQMSFTGHCLRMGTDEPAKIYELYESKIADRKDNRLANRRGRQRKTYIDEISAIMCSDRQVASIRDQIIREAKEGGEEQWKNRYCRPQKKKPPDKGASKRALAR